MSVFHENMLIGSSGQGGAAAAYQIERSLRFNSSDSAYLSRTPASAGNRKTWTWAGWVKRSAAQQTYQSLFTTTSNNFIFRFENDALTYYDYNGSSFNSTLQTAAVYRDYSAWMHVVFAYDSTNATSTERIRLYVNGSRITQFASGTYSVVYPSSNADSYCNNNVEHRIGGESQFSSRLFNGYLADIHFIDGQALTPSSFTEVSATTGQLVPKAYSGSFGTNGFWLKFSDNSAATATTLGKDYSGNSNNWTPNNLSVTAGAGNDSLTDTPTSYGTDTGAGGEVRGNYCTWNPVAKSSTASTFTNGNLDITTPSSGGGNVFGTFALPSSGKWYWEVLYISGNTAMIGISPYSPTANNQTVTGAIFYYTDGRKFISGTGTTYGASYTTNDVIGIAVDVDAGTITFYKNGASQGAISGTVSELFPSLTDGSGAAGDSFATNFGQRPFAYPVSGFKALCDTNLPAPVVAKPSTAFDVKLYTGNGSTQTISGLGFSPDLVWNKNRSGANSHSLFDTIRGATKQLNSNLTDAESTDVDKLTAFTSDGFTVGNSPGVNASSNSYVAWTWDAGSSTVTNTQGSISSQVRANASAGFSVVTYTGTGANATVGHGLGVAPGMVIVKHRNSTGNWQVRHTSIAAANSIQLNLTNAAASATTVWNSTAPSSTVFSVGTDATVNASGGTYVAYCFAPVAGYSSFGSYTGNGSADGPFVYTGFRPRWIMFKCSSTNNGYTFWEIIDTARDNTLAADLSDAEGSYNLGTGQGVDILSNGFKIRGAGSGKNISSATYIYYAVAENPFQYARAR